MKPYPELIPKKDKISENPMAEDKPICLKDPHFTDAYRLEHIRNIWNKKDEEYTEHYLLTILPGYGNNTLKTDIQIDITKTTNKLDFVLKHHNLLEKEDLLKTNTTIGKLNSFDARIWIDKLMSFFQALDIEHARQIFPGYSQTEYINLLLQYLNMVDNEKIRFTKEEILGMMCPTVWVNDRVIDEYFKIIKNNVKINSECKIYVYNTSFFNALMGEKFKRSKVVSNFTRKEDTFKNEKILFPIILQNHWRLICVKVNAGTNENPHIIKYYDSLKETENFTKNYLCQRIKKYLEDEHQHKEQRGATFIIDQTNASPYQDNVNDCGVFTCVNGDFFSRDRKSLFQQVEIDLYRQKITSDLLNTIVETD